MIRSLDPAPFNAVANNPTVRPWLGGKEALDLAPIVANPENFAFLTEDEEGGFLYRKIGIGLYDVHTLASHATRELYRTKADSLRFMFIQTDAIEIVCTIPDGNVAARKWAEHSGFRHLWRREACLDLMGELVGCDYAQLDFAGWIRSAGLFWATELIECCANGNAGKGVGLYNRWAASVGEPQVRVLALQPTVLDFGTDVVEVTADGPRIVGRSPPQVEDEGEPPSLSEPLQPAFPVSRAS